MAPWPPLATPMGLGCSDFKKNIPSDVFLRLDVLLKYCAVYAPLYIKNYFLIKIFRIKIYVMQLIFSDA